MCVFSMVGDHFTDKWSQPDYKDLFKKITTPANSDAIKTYLNPITRQEFDALKKEVEEMKKLLKRATEYDEKNNEPNCEMEDKVKLLKEIAKLVGVDLSDVFKSELKPLVTSGYSYAIIDASPSSVTYTSGSFSVTSSGGTIK